MQGLIIESLVTVNGWLYHLVSCPRMTGRRRGGDDGDPPLHRKRPVPLNEAATMSPARGCCQPTRIVLVTCLDAHGLGPALGAGVVHEPVFSD